MTLADCEGFFWARTKRNVAPSVHTVHLRRTAVRSLFNALHELEPKFVNPTRSLDLPPRGDLRARPLTDNELTSVHVAALGRVRYLDRAALAVALAESTATSGEIPQVRWRHVDLRRARSRFPGRSRFTRDGALSPWGLSVLPRVWDDTSPEPDDFVVSRRGDYADPHSAQAPCPTCSAKVLRAAGVVGDDIRPTSIRLWSGASVLDAHGVEAAAAALGITSLDATRRSLNARRRLVTATVRRVGPRNSRRSSLARSSTTSPPIS